MNTSRLLLMIGLLTGVCFRASSQEWTRFHGPNGTGISHAKTIPAQWTEKDFNWKIELPGTGHSSPVVWGDRVFLTSAQETGDGGFHVLCFNAANGGRLWQRDFPLTPFRKNQFNSFASASPAVDAERVYVCWATPARYTLMALDHDGKTVWERDLGPFVSQHGPGTSPVVYEDRVVLGNVQDGDGFLIAVDAKTGQTRWQTPRRGGREGATAYSTPCVFRPKNGKPVLVFNSGLNGISAIEPDTGAVVWEFDQAFDKRSVSSPVIAESAGLIFGSCGSGGGGNFLSAVRPGDPAGGRGPELAYQIRKSAPYVPTSVVMGEFAYLWSDGGVVTCMQAATGDIKWQERAGGNFFSSPIWVDGRLFCVSRDGEVVVVQATPDQYKELARFALGERSHATPAVSGGRMFLRTEKHLFCVGGGKAPQPSRPQNQTGLLRDPAVLRR